MGYPQAVRRWGIAAGAVGAVLGLAFSALILEWTMGMADYRGAGRMVAIFIPAVLAVSIIGSVIAGRAWFDWRVHARWKS